MKPKSNKKSGGMDNCQTPFYALWPLYPYINKFIHHIWESACGDGLILREFLHNGYEAFGTDINGFEQTVPTDFFKWRPMGNYIQITNPPFSIKYKWLQRSYELKMPFALLLPLETLGAAKAQSLFSKYKPKMEMIVFNHRIDYKMPYKGWDCHAQFPTAWFTLGLNIGRQITYYEFEKPKLEEILEYYHE